MTILFACGHRLSVPDSISEPPTCACGNRQIVRVDAPAPSFRGVCSGPHATTQDLAPITVNLVKDGATPLKLRKISHDE